MKYYKDTAERIQTASNLAQRLSRPQGVPETATDVTKYAFGWINHPTNGEYAAVVDENQNVPIHPYIKDQLNDANSTVSGHFDNFYATQTEADAKKDLVLNSKGGQGNAVGQLNILDILPDEWVEVDKATLESEGWFPPNEL